MTRPNDPRPDWERYRRPPARYGTPPPRPVDPWYQRPARPLPPAPPVKPDHKKIVRQLLIGGGIVVVLVAAALLGAVSQLGGRKVLDVATVQAGVLQTLSDPASGYGVNTVTAVSCNNGRNPNADKGTTFTCDVTVNGVQRHVNVLVSDDDGTYEVDRPR